MFCFEYRTQHFVSNHTTSSRQIDRNLTLQLKENTVIPVLAIFYFHFSALIHKVRCSKKSNFLELVAHDRVAKSRFTVIQTCSAFILQFVVILVSIFSGSSSSNLSNLSEVAKYASIEDPIIEGSMASWASESHVTKDKLLFWSCVGVSLGIFLH